MLYLAPFLTALGGSVLLCTLIIWLSKKFQWKWRSRGGAKHIPRIGGVAALLAFLIAIAVDQNLVITSDIAGLLFGAIVLFAAGLIDDVKDISWKWQLGIQAALVVSVIVFFSVQIESITIPFGSAIYFQGALFWIGAFLTFVWFLSLINAMNWIDGIDGLSPGIMVLASLVLFAVSLRPEVMQPPVAILAITLAGSYLGLFFFNFPAAKIFSGTVGTFFGGFAIAYLSIFAGAKIASAFLVLSIPLFDALWVVWKRVQAGHHVTMPDKRHMHFVLQKKFGWSKRRTLFVLLGAVFILAFISMTAGSIGKLFASIFVIGVFLVIALKKMR